MKILGLIGGISWVSTVDYYKYINEGINAKLGGMNFARLMLHSMNYGDIKKNNESGNWDATLELLTEAALNMKAGGASGIVLCANTMHLLAEKLEDRTGLPVIHIAEETAKAVRQKGLKKLALLGTKFTMEMDFFKARLHAQNISVMIPDEDDRAFIHRTIGDELGSGLILPATKARYLEIIGRLKNEGAEGVILGCTEIPLLISQEDIDIPAFDTTRIHAAAAVAFALGE